MPTNEERREVAAELRYTGNDCLDGGGLLPTLKRVLGVEGSWRKVFARLADLIDPTGETCELELTRGGHTNAHVRTYECSRCGKSCDNIWGEDYEFCPYCGRRAENADE